MICIILDMVFFLMSLSLFFFVNGVYDSLVLLVIVIFINKSFRCS